MIMKQKYIFILLTVLSAVFACTRVDEDQLVPEEPVQEKVQMTFTAVIDEADNTKTLLEGALGDGFRNVLWQPGDAIGISSDIEHMMLGSVEKFVANTETAALSTEFDGFISMSPKYKAFYPYSETLKDSSSYFIFTLPAEQKYVENTFDPAAATMVAVADYGETLKFRNLCGVLALQLTGEETVNSIVFSGFDESGNLMKVSGTFEVDPHQDSLSIKPLGKSYSSVRMNCKTPVKLSATTPTAFHMVLPAGTYSKFTVMIVTDDGVMYKEATKPLTIKRSEVQPTAALMYVESEYIDLSAAGTANSYIVSKGAGLYSFDATVIGNGIYGFIDGVEFHTDSPYIKPTKAKLIWEDRVGVINNVNFDGERVVVATTGKEGNALIAVTDNNEDILWSWHIWVTDQPQEQVYVNSTGNYPMMDRNLGAIRADRGTANDFYDAHGLLYQWGRKDPFAVELSDISVGSYGQMFHTTASSTTLNESIRSPKTMFVLYEDSWESAKTDSLWSSTQKTIYDPCPAGYTIPLPEVWYSFSKTESSNITNDINDFNAINLSNEGADFIYDGKNTTFYPHVGYVNHYHCLYFTPSTYDFSAFMWSSRDDGYWEYKPSYAYGFSFRATPQYVYLNLQHQEEKSQAHTVRCMKDAGYEATCVPMVKITVKDKFTDGANVVGKIPSQGLSAVTECGFVWGTSSDITLENASSQKVDAANFTYTITGLENATKYYVRAYAKNENGVGYSEPQFFYTVWEGEAIDLSKNGTANCYIVTPYCAEYSFNATVRGNSTEPVGNIASVEVLWETEMMADDDVSTNYVKVGDIISKDSLKIENGYVHFMLPYEPKEGNALIAVKDANGTILWSWHIWVVDFDPNTTQKTYDSGFVMMDRNLGATSVVPSSFPDYTAYGLYYQWGRKDPLVNSVCAPRDAIQLYGNDYIDDYNYIEYTYANPTVFRDDWDGGTGLWKDEKTINDPCPAGWRVPNIMVWNSWYGVGDCPSGNYLRISSPYSDSTTYYPFAGVGDWTSIGDLGTYGYYWSSTRSQILQLWNCHCNPTSGLNSGNKASVRCMKDEKIPVTGGGKDYIVDDEYEW